MKLGYWELYLIKLSLPYFINPFASPNAGAPALKYRYVNTVTPSPGEVKGLIFRTQYPIPFL